MINIEAVFSSVTGGINKYISGVLKSTLWTSIFIITIIFFILMTIFPTQREKPFYVIMKPVLYMFFAIFITLFLHDAHILDLASKTVLREETDNIVGGMREFRNRETNIYKALNSNGGEDIIKPRVDINDDAKSITSEKSIHDDVRSVTSDVSEGVVDTSALLADSKT